MKGFWKWTAAVIVGMVIGCYTAFVAECYWNWFVVEALHASEVSFLQMLGLIWLLQLLTSRSTVAEDSKFKLLASAVELCVPAEKQEELHALGEETTFRLWWEAFFGAFGQLFSNTFMLGAGFVLHLFV